MAASRWKLRSSENYCEKLGKYFAPCKGFFGAPELITSIYFAPKHFISVKITVEEKPRPYFIFYASLIGLVNYIQG